MPRPPPIETDFSSVNPDEDEGSVREDAQMATHTGFGATCPEMGARPETANSRTSNGSKLSESKRQRLQALLDKEELKDAIMKKLQVLPP